MHCGGKNQTRVRGQHLDSTYLCERNGQNYMHVCAEDVVSVQKNPVHEYVYMCVYVYTLTWHFFLTPERYRH